MIEYTVEAELFIRRKQFNLENFIRNSSFCEILDLESYPQIYFLKEQKLQFIKILKQSS